MSEHERNDLLDRLGEHYAPAPLDPPRAARIRAHAEEQRQGGRVRFGALGAGGTLALAALALLLLRAPAPPPGAADPDLARVAWADGDIVAGLQNFEVRIVQGPEKETFPKDQDIFLLDVRRKIA